MIEELPLFDDELLLELSGRVERPGLTPNQGAIPAIVANKSRLGPELLGAGISCTLAVISAVGVLGGVAAEVPTGGASSFLVLASWAGMLTQGVQCLNGLVRVGASLAAPNDNTLERWDQEAWYANTILFADAVGVAAGIGSLPFAVRNLWAVLSRQANFAARSLTFETLRAMNRSERLNVIREVFEQAARTPEGRRALMEAAGKNQMGHALARPSGLSVRHAVGMAKIISDETVRRLSASLREVLGTVGGTIASGTPASLTGSASGSVNYIINLIPTSSS
jgi:hypothetical protein